MEPSPESGGEDAAEETAAEIERFTDTTAQTELRPRNRAWDALHAIFEYQPEGTEQALWGKLSRRAHESADDPEKGSGDPALEVMARAKRLMAQWGAKALTPPSLLKHWDRFGSRLGAITDEEESRLRDEWDRAERRRRMTEADHTQIEGGTE